MPARHRVQVRHTAQPWESEASAALAFLTASCSTQLQMFPQHSTQLSKICIRFSFGEEEILREPLQIPEQIRHSALELEKESESRSQSGEQKNLISVCVESLVLDLGPTNEGS